MMRRLFSILNNRGAITRRGVIAGAFLTVAVVGIVGALVVVSGLMPITASSGHWAVTEWFLHFTMRRSVATHSLGIHAPPTRPAAGMMSLALRCLVSASVTGMSASFWGGSLCPGRLRLKPRGGAPGGGSWASRAARGRRSVA